MLDLVDAVLIMRGVLNAVVLCGISDAYAHPGGTDRFGCHVESANGIRHCHGDEGDGGVAPTLTAQLGIELGKNWRASTGEPRTAFVSAGIQHDGSVAFLVNIGGHWPHRRGIQFYGDLGLGLAWLTRADVYPMGRVGLGARFPVWFVNEQDDSSVYVKVGVIIDLIVDGNEAETFGAAASVGFAL